MLKKFLAVAVLIAPLTLAPSMAPVVQADDFSVAEMVQGMLDPHVFAGAGYNDTTKKWSAVLTASVVGPKLGTWPCYALGAGVSLGTIAPGLDNLPIAHAAVPLLTCAPFGERVAFQGGIATPLNGGDGLGKTYYFAGGISLSGGPTAIKTKRIQRAQAKAAKKRAEAAQEGPPAPASN